MIHFQILVPVLKQTATRFATNLLSFDSVFFYYFNHNQNARQADSAASMLVSRFGLLYTAGHLPR